MNEKLFVDVALSSWNLVTGRADAIFASLTDDQLQQEFVPGRNRISYLLGHLAAVHDGMLPLLGLGERLHPELDEPFLKQPDRAIEPVPAPAQLRAYWVEVQSALNKGFTTLAPTDWLQRHNAMSDEDYAKDPTRNKLAILINRTNHVSYHLGQIKLHK